jgi:Ca2+-binding RTX toxin-like protein
MAIIKGTPNGETLTRTLAANIIAGLGGKDRQFGVDGSGLLDGGDGHDNIDGGFGNDTLIGGGGNDDRNEGEVAGRRAVRTVTLFNIFRPF